MYLLLSLYLIIFLNTHSFRIQINWWYFLWWTCSFQLS